MIAFLKDRDIATFPLVAYDPAFDKVDGGCCALCMAWVPQWREGFDWRGAGPHARWNERNPTLLWPLRPSLVGLLRDFTELTAR